jgi:glycosyltransferase involved in cell wall biosynthesis
MKRILICADYFSPGYKAGGPIQTISALVEQLAQNFEFLILTRNHDWSEVTPYIFERNSSWQQIGSAKVFYDRKLSFKTLRGIITEVKPDILYLNSFFSRISIRILLMRLFKLVPSLRVVLAPRGELSSGALRLKSVRKRLFIFFAIRVGLYDDLLWQASSSGERSDILRAVNPHAKVETVPIYVAPDLASSFATSIGTRKKEIGEARFIFLSRIDRMKNLKYALERVNSASGKLIFDVYGPLGNKDYWEECQPLLNVGPPNVQVRYRGPVPHADLFRVMSLYHFLLLPTRGESFGHIILEAWAAGLPVIISDQTPWQDLQDKGIGWVLPLNAPNLWNEVLETCVAMGQSEYARLSLSARKYAVKWIANPATREKTIQLFQTALVVPNRTGERK